MVDSPIILTNNLDSDPVIVGKTTNTEFGRMLLYLHCARACHRLNFQYNARLGATRVLIGRGLAFAKLTVASRVRSAV